MNRVYIVNEEGLGGSYVHVYAKALSHMPTGEEQLTVEARKALEEDFKHQVEQTELSWKTRDKMASIRQRKSEMR